MNPAIRKILKRKAQKMRKQMEDRGIKPLPFHIQEQTIRDLTKKHE